jgi:O-antigen ligase
MNAARSLERVAGPAPKARPGKAWIYQLTFIAAHVPLAILIPKHSSLAAWHAMGSVAVGVFFALFSRRWERAAYVAAYIVGAEVFWRMRAAEIPWESAKYAVVLILGIALARFGRRPRSLLPVAYFALLLPSVYFTVAQLDRQEAREQVSFNLSGPLALAVSALFFCSLRLTRGEMRWLYVSLVAPVVSIAYAGVMAFQKYAPTEFGTGSNPLTSGGFGPNQVSAALGLGVLFAFLYLVIGTGNKLATGAFVVLALFLFRQTAITFSRGGLYMAVGGMAAASFFLAGDRKSRLRLAGVLALALPILFFVIWPRLESLTGGAIGERFSSLESTGRDLLIKADLKTWAENPVLGVGPGLGGKNRLIFFHASTAHTEYSRMVSDHGLLGFVSLLMLVAMAFGNLRAATTRLERALAAAVLAYSVLSMAVDGMRISAGSFAFGLSGARLLIPRRQSAAAGKPARKVRVAVRP